LVEFDIGGAGGRGSEGEGATAVDTLKDSSSFV